MSGRIAAVAARNEGGKTTLYVGAASGGVWKSLDGGTTFKPVFDKQPVQSIGAITIDPSNPKTVWVGTGESWTRNSVSIGDGIYKSTDGGETWTNMGLPESERIARILVHPKNSDVVYACVPGQAVERQRRSRPVQDRPTAARRWSLVLKGANLSTGCSSVTMDPKNPDVLLRRACGTSAARAGRSARAATGPTRRAAAALFRSRRRRQDVDASSTRRRERACPPRRGAASRSSIAPSDPKIVYALIESKDVGALPLRRRRRDLGGSATRAR